MTWVGLLLADPSPCLRLRVLRELLDRTDDDGEVQELLALRSSDPLLAETVAAQDEDGSWPATREPDAPTGDSVYATAVALLRLGYLGLGPEHDSVRRGAEYLFSQQQADGAWPLHARRCRRDGGDGYSMMPMQTAIPLHGLAMCGYAPDARAEKAYEWLLAQRLPEGAWPTGIAGGDFGYVGGYRRIAHSRWGCRSNTTGALNCLALHPQRRTGDAARRALDLLLGRETRETQTLGFEVARRVGFEPSRGFITHYARFDLAQMLDLCARVGASPANDERVAALMAFVREQQGEYGLWEYAPRPQASRWVTFDVLRSLRRLGGVDGEAWVGLEPRTPYRSYSRERARY